MLPNLSGTVKRFSQDVKLIRVTTSIVNHQPVETETVINIRAVVQPAQREKILKDKLDYSLRYVLVHSLDEILINDKLEHKGIIYRAIECADHSDYGYYEAVMEQQK